MVYWEMTDTARGNGDSTRSSNVPITSAPRKKFPDAPENNTREARLPAG